MRWKCSGCHDLAPTNQYVFCAGEEWYDEVYRLIIRPGKLRRCRRCRPDPDVKIAGHECSACRKVKHKNEYPSSMWHHKATQRALCFTCFHPPCTCPTCLTCSVCRDPHCQEKQCSRDVVPLNSSELPQSQEDVDAFVCLNCRHPCNLCGEKKGKSGFPISMWHHRHSRQILCNQCCNPRCTAQHCSRCRVCRDIHCRKRVCHKPVKPLHPQQFLKSKQELETYLCELCRYITCSCGARMPKPMQKRQRLCTGDKKYVCVDCQ